MNELIAAESADALSARALVDAEHEADDPLNGDCCSWRPVASASEPLFTLDFGDSNVASCYGHCWKYCMGCLV